MLTYHTNQWHQHLDLTTDYGRQWFYATIRDFFSMVPPKHWAMIDSKPIVLLYSAAFNAAYTGCAETVKLTGGKTWKTAQFALKAARFINSQNGGADLRLVVAAPEFHTSKVTLQRQ